MEPTIVKLLMRARSASEKAEDARVAGDFKVYAFYRGQRKAMIAAAEIVEDGYERVSFSPWN